MDATIKRLNRLAAAISRGWRHGVIPTLSLTAIVGFLEWWALRARDPDFPIPDPFHGLVLAVIGTYVVVGFVPWARVRQGALIVLFGIPLVIILLELRLAGYDRSLAESRIAFSDDLLLRYTYRPGATVDDPEKNMTITDDGLWDAPHVVPKPLDVDRVVVLGDSVPNDSSIPFRKRFPKLLEALLARAAPAGRRVEVINVSCEGYNTIQEVRLLEKVGLKYQPDLIVLAYVLNDPFLQNGAYRRIGNSYFAFRGALLWTLVTGGSWCRLFAPYHEGYAYDLVVRSSLERLRLITERSRVAVLVATLPIIERFDDPACLAAYDKTLAVARSQGFATARLVDAFAGEDHVRYLKPGARMDITHPNAEGHVRMAGHLAPIIAGSLWGARPEPVTQ